MHNDGFDFYPEHQQNMRFEKPMHGPPGRGPPGHHMRSPGPPHMRPPGPMRRGMPDMPPNFRGPREPLYDDYPHGPPMGMPFGPGKNVGPPGPHFGGNSPQHMNQQHNFASPPRNQHAQQGMPPPGNGPFQKNRAPIPYPPPAFGGAPNGSNMYRPPQHTQNPNIQQNSATTPNVSLDFWVETENGGKTYFYHAKTRETTWTRPTNVKVIRQDEIEKLLSANEKNSNANSFAPFVPPVGPMACPMPAPTNLLPPPPAAFGLGPFAIPPPGLMFPYGLPPPNFGPVPQMNPATSDASGNDVTTTASVTKTGNEDKEWDQYLSVDGKPYYVNRVTKETCWEKPEKMQVENIQVEVSETAKESCDPVEKTEADSSTSVMDVDEGESIKTEPPNSEISPQEVIPEKSDNMDTHLVQPEEKSENDSGHLSPSTPLKVEEEEKKEIEENTSAEEGKKQPVDKSRPVSSTPIPKTQWFLVWTGDKRCFFYSHITRTSVWQRPEELKGNIFVDKLLQEPPTLPSETTSPVKSETETSVSSNDKTTESDCPETKRAKLENAESENTSNSKAPVKTCITHGKESAIEAELRAAKERAVIALDVRMAQFVDLLIEKDVSAFSTWEKELHKIVFDPRYLLLTSKERKNCFEKYVKDRAEAERSEKRKLAKEKKEEFSKLLKEASLTSKSSFSDFASRYAKDPRFRSIDKMRERENLFNLHIENLHKKERDERSSLREKIKSDFFELLKENDEMFQNNKRWQDVKKSLSSDARYKAVDSSSLREQLFKEYITSSSSHSHDKEDGEDDAVKEREKQERIQASIREREKEVERTLSTHLRERDKERENHKRDSAVSHFKALLTDLVRSPDVSWHELKRTIRKDHRSDIMACLTREERETVFDEHISFLYRKKKEKFRELLEETQDITLTSSWKEVKKLIKDDPRCSKFSSSDRKCEKEFKEYLKDKMVALKADFRELLKETKMITYKSRKLIDETDHLHDIEKVLQNDKRYLVLQCIENERHALLMSYIETLDRKGPPPPPTASEPSRRSTK